MADPIHIDNTSVPPDHRFNNKKVGRGKKHKNVSPGGDRRVFIQVEACTLPPQLMTPPAKGAYEDPLIPVIDRSVSTNFKCLVDSGTDVSLFRPKIARELGLQPGGGKMENTPLFFLIGGRPVNCWLCKYTVYLDIGPNLVPVTVGFPVQCFYTSTGKEFRWREDILQEDILGMESVLDRYMLCFTPDSLFVFENQK